MQRRMPASIARSNAGMPEERVIVTAVTLPSEVCNFTWYSAVGFSAPLREASDKPRPAARRHGLWRHSPRRGRRIRRSGCGRRCRPGCRPRRARRCGKRPEGLVGGRLLAASSLAFFSAAAFSAATFSAAAFRRPPSRQQPFGGGLLGGVFLGLLLGGDLSAAAFSAAALSAAALSAAWRSCSRRFFPSARPACALPPGAPFPGGLGGFARLFLFLTLLLGLLQRDLRVDFRLGRLDLGFGRRRGGSGCFCGSGSGCGLG